MVNPQLLQHFTASTDRPIYPIDDFERLRSRLFGISGGIFGTMLLIGLDPRSVVDPLLPALIVATLTLLLLYSAFALAARFILIPTSRSAEEGIHTLMTLFYQTRCVVMLETSDSMLCVQPPHGSNLPSTTMVFIVRDQQIWFNLFSSTSEITADFSLGKRAEVLVWIRRALRSASFVQDRPLAVEPEGMARKSENRSMPLFPPIQFSLLQSIQILFANCGRFEIDRFERIASITESSRLFGSANRPYVRFYGVRWPQYYLYGRFSILSAMFAPLTVLTYYIQNVLYRNPMSHSLLIGSGILCGFGLLDLIARRLRARLTCVRTTRSADENYRLLHQSFVKWNWRMIEYVEGRKIVLFRPSPHSRSGGVQVARGELITIVLDGSDLYLNSILLAQPRYALRRLAALPAYPTMFRRGRARKQKEAILDVITSGRLIEQDPVRDH